jgi:hypothetical protein
MQRLRLIDCRLSRLPRVVGACSADINTIADYVNTAQRRLLYCKEAGEESWNGTWAEIAFNVSRTQPHITLPRGVARLELVNVCQRPIPIQNQFYEYLEFGNGRMPKLRSCLGGHGRILQVYSRNNVPTFTDLTPGSPQFIVIYPSDPGDVDGTKRVFLQGLDQNGVRIVTKDGGNVVDGMFVPIVSPFATAPFQMSEIQGVQKDITDGPIQFFAMDPATGVQTLLLTMEPGETTAWYRRYLFNPLPFNCCQTVPPVQPSTPQLVQVTAISKLDLIPVVVDTDYCLIQNLEAIIEECSSVRYSEVDSATSKQMAQEKHRQAVGLLNGELTHFYGQDTPALAVQPFGSAKLSRLKVGMV